MTWRFGHLKSRRGRISLATLSAGLAIARAGADKVAAYIAATRQLLALGHRQIALIVRRPRRKPVPGLPMEW